MGGYDSYIILVIFFNFNGFLKIFIEDFITEDIYVNAFFSVGRKDLRSCSGETTAIKDPGSVIVALF